MHLHNVWAKQKAPGPVNCYFKSSKQCRDFGEVHAPPEKPRDKTGYAKSANFGHRIVMTDGCHKAERPIRKWPRFLALQHPAEIRRKLLGLAHSELCRWRTCLAVPEIRHSGAVPQCPHIAGLFDSHIRIRRQSAMLQRESK